MDHGGSNFGIGHAHAETIHATCVGRRLTIGGGVGIVIANGTRGREANVNIAIFARVGLDTRYRAMPVIRILLVRIMNAFKSGLTTQVIRKRRVAMVIFNWVATNEFNALCVVSCVPLLLDNIGIDYVGMKGVLMLAIWGLRQNVSVIGVVRGVNLLSISCFHGAILSFGYHSIFARRRARKYFVDHFPDHGVVVAGTFTFGLFYDYVAIIDCVCYKMAIGRVALRHYIVFLR